MPAKHVPLRTCIACRQGRPKRELVRVVRSQDGAVTVDPTGKAHGRGAYLCRARACWQRALQRGTLAHALKGPIEPEAVEALRVFAETLPDTTAVESQSS
jgi:predicted RNA-binding protein YlxR (DUF448 family)